MILPDHSIIIITINTPRVLFQEVLIMACGINSLEDYPFFPFPPSTKWVT